MPYLRGQLDIEKCPHCKVDKPSLHSLGQFQTKNYVGQNERFWRVYHCNRCGGVILASSGIDGGAIREMYPSGTEVDESIPDRARDFLNQALNTIHAPAGSIMLSASAVDTMLKVKGYKEGSL